MLKKITYLVMLLLVMALPLASAARQETPDTNWQKLDFGNYADKDYYFNTNTLKFGTNADGTPNTNIIIYEEKAVITSPTAVQYKFYSITHGKINIENQQLQLGTEQHFTRKGKLRWEDTPRYKVWIDVKPDTYGYLRYQQITKYVAEHKAEILAHTKEAN